MDHEMSQLFQEQIKLMRAQQLTNMLKCKICDGLYRFAHTIVDCGHTFCQICILTYIKGFKGKNPEVKCPQCHALIDANYRRSIIKDVFKQSLVDMLDPSFVDQDNLIINRVKKLFPEIDLEFLLDEFTFSTFELSKSKKKSQQKNDAMSQLPEKVKEKLGINFENFTEMITNDQHYEYFLEILQKKNAQKKAIQIKPKTERDYKYVGINNQMKVSNLNIQKIRRFLEKKALDKITQTEDVPNQWLNPQGDKFNVQIFLSIKEKKLTTQDSLQLILKQNSGPLLYSLTL